MRKVQTTPPVSQRREAVAYARVSSKEQEREGFSIPAQQRLIADYAHANGITIVREFVDIETAKASGRTQFGEMLAFLKANSMLCRTLLVEKTDRLYRNVRDWVTLDELDVEIHFVKENTVISRDSKSSEKFVHGIKVLMAKNYVDNLGEETRKGLVQKVDEGGWPSQAPLGYVNVILPNGKKGIAPDPVMGPLVTTAFELYATGRYGIHAVLKQVTDAGLRTKKNNKVLRATLHTMLRNPFYKGEFLWKQDTYHGAHEPLVSHSLWQAVQDVLDNKRVTKVAVRKHEHAFARLISCGHCGCALVGEMKKGRYTYYRCTWAKGRCPDPHVREEVLSEQFAHALDALTFDAEVLEQIRKALFESHEEAARFHREAVSRLQTEYNRAQSRIEALYLDKLDGRIDASFYDRMATTLRGDQDKITRALQEHQNANATYLEEGARLLELAQKAASLFRAQPSDQQRRLLDFVVSNSRWANGRLAVEYREPFGILADHAVSLRERSPAKVDQTGERPEWLPVDDTTRTENVVSRLRDAFINPSGELLKTLRAFRELRGAA